MTTVVTPVPPTASTPLPVPTQVSTTAEADAPAGAASTGAVALPGDASTDPAPRAPAGSDRTASLARRATTTAATWRVAPVHRAVADIAARGIDRVGASALVTRLWRCATVSAFTTVLSNLVLVGLAGPIGLDATWAAVVANAVGTGPSYALNRRWVWHHHGSDPWRQVIPFWVLSFAGLGLSAMTVSLTAARVDGAGLIGPARSVTLVAANVAAFASLWLAQFVLLDRVLFGRRRGAPGAVRDVAVVPDPVRDGGTDHHQPTRA